MVAPQVRQINQAAAGALATDVVLTDPLTTLAFQTLTKPNRLLDITNEADPIAGLRYHVRTEKNRKELRRWFSVQLLTTIDRHVGFPLDINSGNYQWIGQQSAGALTAQNYLCTWLTDL